MGDGKGFRFWEDNWRALQPVVTLYHDIYVISTEKELVLDCWNSLKQAWDLGLWRNLFDREVGSSITCAQLLNSWVVNGNRSKLPEKSTPQASFLRSPLS